MYEKKGANLDDHRGLRNIGRAYAESIIEKDPSLKENAYLNQAVFDDDDEDMPKNKAQMINNRWFKLYLLIRVTLFNKFLIYLYSKQWEIIAVQRKTHQKTKPSTSVALIFNLLVMSRNEQFKVPYNLSGLVKYRQA